MNHFTFKNFVADDIQATNRECTKNFLIFYNTVEYNGVFWFFTLHNILHNRTMLCSHGRWILSYTSTVLE